MACAVGAPCLRPNVRPDMKAMGFRAKAVLLVVSLTLLGYPEAYGVYYETHCWTFGKSPYRVGLVEIKENGKVATMICLGNEVGVGDNTLGCYFTVQASIYMVAAGGCLLFALPPAIAFYVYRRRHAEVA